MFFASEKCQTPIVGVVEKEGLKMDIKKLIVIATTNLLNLKSNTMKNTLQR